LRLSGQQPCWGLRAALERIIAAHDDGAPLEKAIAEARQTLTAAQ